MKTAIIALVLLLVLVPVSRADLMMPVAMAGASGSETLFLAYSDNTVWWAHGYPLEIPAANRGIPIRLMCSQPGGVLILYDDNQLYTVWNPNGCQFLADLARPDAPTLKPVQLATGAGIGIVVAYEDGQIWVWTSTHWAREPMWERLAQATPVQGSTWGTVKGAFR